MSRIYVLHENDAWVEPLRAAFALRDLPYEEWFLDGGHYNLSQAPPEGVFYSRMSASAHTRGHRHAAEYAGAVLAWLEGHGRRVVNGTRALALEVSKAAQHVALEAAGIRTPRTVVTAGREQLLAAAGSFGEGPLILKPNRGGKGLGVQRFDSPAALRAHVKSPAYEAPLDGIALLQQYVSSADGSIVRCEFVGGRFMYAVRVETGGAFELCPADACAIGDAACPVGEPPGPAASGPRFTIERSFRHPLLRRYEAFLAANGIEIAGIEFITDADGVTYTYDVNTNTNYNAAAEAATDRSGMGAIADFLSAELAGLHIPHRWAAGAD